MKIVYFILAHKLPKQLVRLVNKLDTSSSTFLIHVDKKTDKETYLSMMKPLSGNTNVHFIKRRTCNWGAFGHVQATLDGIRRAIELDLEFDYMVLLTGQDYPIKSNEYILEFFEKSNGKSYLEYFSLPAETWKQENGGMDRINYLYLYFFGRTHKVFPRFFLKYSKLLNGLKIYGGRSNWYLSRNCIEYIDKYMQQEDDFIKFCKYVHVPDEIFFHTILLNSNLKDHLVNDNFKYVVWPASAAAHPNILRSQDFEHFIHTNKIFARKFDITQDAKILDMIDEVTT